MSGTSHLWLNKEFLQQALRSGEKDSLLEVKKCDVYPGTNPGDNYATIVYRAAVEANTKHGQKSYKLVMKVIPEAELRQEFIYDLEMFHYEVKMYEEIFPEFRNFEKQKNVVHSLLTSVPHCFYAQNNQNREAIILDDLSPFGFKMADRRKGVDFEHSRLVMQELGKFHSLSFALKNESSQVHEKYKGFKDRMFSEKSKEKIESFFSASLNSVVSTIEPLPDYKKFIPQLEKLKDSIFQSMNDYCRPEEPLAVLNHGDCWINNMLFLYGDGNSSTVPEELKFVDFQVVRYASPVIDILYFLFLSTSKQLRDEKMEELLRIYYQSFNESLKILGSKAEVFTFQTLWNDLLDKYMFGFLTALTIIPFIVAEPNQVPDLDSITEEEFMSATSNPFFDDKDYSENSVLMTRIKEVLREMEEKGYLTLGRSTDLQIRVAAKDLSPTIADETYLQIQLHDSLKL